jgi:hypothetical protein
VPRGAGGKPENADPARQVSWNQWDGRVCGDGQARPARVYIMPVKGYFEGSFPPVFWAKDRWVNGLDRKVRIKTCLLFDK